MKHEREKLKIYSGDTVMT